MCTDDHRCQRSFGRSSLGSGPLRGPSTRTLTSLPSCGRMSLHTLCELHPDSSRLRSLPSPSRRLLGVDNAPFRSCILVAHGPTFRLGKRSAAMVPGVSSRTERLSTLLATAKLQVRIASPQTLYCGRGVAEVKAGRFPAVDDQVLGRRHISVPVLGSREDPPELTPLRGNLRGCHSPSCLVSGLAPPFSQAWVFPVENGGGAVGLDPSGACVRSCFSQVSTMVGHPCG
jgi:hypothetical protein